jgi:hypothetical protein
MGFMDNFREGRNQARAARGAPPLSRKEPVTGPEQDGAADQAANDAGQNSAAVAELQAALQERDGELTENKRLLNEMADYAEKMEARVVELIAGAERMAEALEKMEARMVELKAGAEPMARTLRLPGVKNFLVNTFHPDPHRADARKYELMTEALKTINAAYECADQLKTPSSE